MIFLKLFITIFVIVVLLGLIKKYSKSDPKTIRKISRFIVIGIAIVLIIFFIRVGLPHFAAITGAIIAALPIVTRITSFLLTLNAFKSLLGLKTKVPHSQQSNKMSKEDAREILGVSKDATNTEIKKAYQEQMKKNHPDKGGSAYIAKQLNDAKDTLLK